MNIIFCLKKQMVKVRVNVKEMFPNLRRENFEERERTFVRDIQTKDRRGARIRRDSRIKHKDLHYWQKR